MAQGIFTPKQHIQGLQQKSWNTAFGSTYAAYLKGDQSGQYLTGPTTSVLNFSTGNFTLEFWIHLYAVPSGLALIFSASNAGADFQVGYSTGNNVYWHNTGIQITSASSSLALGRWVHIALIRSGSTVGLFCNGVRVGSTSNSAAINLTNFNIGSYWVSPVSYMVNGLVSNLRITNTAVYDPTQTSIGLPTSVLTKISGTQLLTLQNSTLVDNSDNALSITNNGSIGIQAVSPFGIQLQTPTVEYLVVAGGGGGDAGGGGAGGLLQGHLPIVTGSSIPITIGGGGSGGYPGSSGSNSVFSSIIAIGGGKGSMGINNYNSDVSGGAYSGGSGGGAFQNSIAGNGTLGQGNNGANSVNYAGSCAGGGGGAGSSAYYATVNYYGGNGGSGIASAITGTVTTYAGGGAGGGYYSNASGGVGGGGNVITAGAINTGGGGGGYTGSTSGAAGGSGIVVISYPDVYAAATVVTGSPIISTSGSGSLTGNSLTASTGRFNYAGQTPFSFGTGDFTIEFWAYFTNTSAAANYLIDFRGSSAPTGSVFGIYQNSSGLRYFSSSVGDYGFIGVPAQNTWYSIAATRVSGTVRLFVNGDLKTTFIDTYSYSVGNTGPSIMSSSYYNDYGFNGYVSNFRIIKGTGLYTASYTPSTVPLTAVSGTSLLLNTVSGAYLTDSSINAHTPSVTNTMAWNQASPFATGLGYKNRVYTWTQNGTVTF